MFIVCNAEFLTIRKLMKYKDQLTNSKKDLRSEECCWQKAETLEIWWHKNTIGKNEKKLGNL